MPGIDPNAAACGDGIFGLDDAAGDAAVVLVPAPFDATTSYRPGTAAGPDAILTASRQLDLHDHETGEPWQVGIAMLPAPEPIAAHNRSARALVEGLRERDDPQALARVNALCAEVNDTITATVGTWLDAGKLVGLVGGDHATAFGSIRAQAERNDDFGVLHIDAHADLRRAYEGFSWSHASVMDAVCEGLPSVSRLVQVGVRDFCDEERERINASDGRIRTFLDVDLQARLFAGEAWGAVVRDIVACLPRDVYVSFDVDGLDPKLCPHTGTPVPGGLSFNQATFLLREVVRSGRRIIGFDLVEVAPGPDGDEWDGNVGARLLYKLIGWTLLSRAPSDT